MRRSFFVKSVFVLALMFVCNLTISAASPRNYIYDTKEENGKIVSKVIFLQEEGLLNKEVKYEFAYNEDGMVMAKTAFRWNKDRDEWNPFYLTTYTYSTDKSVIHSVYAMWDKSKKNFSLNKQEMQLPVSNYDNIFQ